MAGRSTLGSFLEGSHITEVERPPVQPVPGAHLQPR
jgi:hypothetical protein